MPSRIVIFLLRWGLVNLHAQVDLEPHSS
jgi:hypothetical protein